jgi:RHS repeat-associated protein
MKNFYYTFLFLAFSLCSTAQTAPTGGSTEVGITEGQLSVSLTGGATYSVPIAVPPGINGVVPQISLAYNSQGGNGMAGYGWNISGVSAITRIPSTKFHDGTIDPVDFDALDRFAFDGQRLILKSGTYGGNGTVYETENFSNIKITSYGVHPSGANYGPEYFTVEYPDGSIAYYGQNQNQRSVMEWGITLWKNPQGVQIVYEYKQPGNTLIIDNIYYGGIAGEASINKIHFEYKSRSRSEQAYVGGLSIVNSTILSEINVTGKDGVGFRNYVLGHDMASLGYDRLKSVTEKSGVGGKSYNPTTFEYGTEYNGISSNSSNPKIITNLSLGSMNSQNSASVSGDFDGDAKMDFLLYPTTGSLAKTKFWLFTNIANNTLSTSSEISCGNFEEIFPSTALTIDKKVNTSQGITVVQLATDSRAVNFNTYFAVSGSAYLQHTKQVTFTAIGDCYGDQPKFKKYLSGDFNGDGLTDVIAIDKELECVQVIEDPWDGTRNIYTHSSSGKVYFVDLDTRKTTNFWNETGTLLDYFDETDRIETTDINGDGKTDILHFTNGKVIVYTLNYSNKLVFLWKTEDPGIVRNRSILLGDYNGDGKMDFIIPKSSGDQAYDYVKYLSTGNSFVRSDETYAFANKNSIVVSGGIIVNNLIPLDFNGDGKTDIVHFRAGYGDTFGGGRIIITAYKNDNLNFNSSSTFDTLPINGVNGIRSYPIPIFLSPNTNNQYLEVSAISNNSIYTFNSQKDFSKEGLLNTITTGNGATETITYKSLQQDSELTYTPSSNVEVYPNIDIPVAPSFKIVSKLEKKSDKVYKKQLFSYYGAVSNIEGLGFLGFRSSVKTNWHDDSNPIISSISKFDVSQRGANTENYTVLGFHAPLTTIIDQKARIITKEGDYTVTGTENLIATQRITLKPDTWIQPGSSFTAKIIPDANSAGGALTDFITKSVLTYESDVLSNKVFKIQNTISKQYNALENTNSETTTVYDGYNNPTQSTTLLKEGGATVQTSVSNVAYDNQPTGSVYYIGRPTNKIQSVAVNGDSMTSEEQYGYTNHLLTQIKKKGNNTDFITEDNIYDTFGNIKTKTITAAGLKPRVTNYVYDPSGRFLTNSSDIETLTTTFDYNLSSGVLNFEINPYGLKTIYEYDSWFKKIKTTDYLGKSNTYVYTRSGNVNTLVTTTGDDGSASQELFDDLGRKIKTGVKDITGNMSNVDYYYDIYDRNFKVSEPYYGASPSQFNITEYDVYGRVFKSASFTGKIVNIDYPMASLVTNVNDGSKTKTSTKNAIGKVVAMTDTPGGTINYTYFANGNLKSSNYEGVTTTIEQDGWGRKTKLTDPSAGIYSYAYNGFGETTSETTPNGTTTYELNDFGKLKKKTISGTNTNSVSEYFYDGSSKLLSTSTFNDIKEGTQTNYTYTYDSSKRIVNTEEATPFYGTSFKKLISYDAFGRIEYETSTASIAGKTSAKKIKSVYKNGAAWQIVDDGSQQILWQTNEVNARGQLTKATLGNGIDITNTYDQFGFTKELKHDKTGGAPVNVMTLTTNFDEKKGNLKNRINSLFNNGLEVFEYDALDRLTKYPNALGQQVVQDYDARGRITKNNIGTYNYDSAKPYQNKEILLTPEAHGYYLDREGIFNDSMEEQKDWQKPDSGVFFDKTNAHTGSTSFKISNANTTEKYAHSEVWIPISNSVETEYTYSAWVYTDNPQAELFLFMKTPTEAGYFTFVNSVTTNVKNQWVLLEKTFKVPANITKLNIRLDNNGQGNVWFDDIQIRKTSNTATAVRNLNIDYNVYKSPTKITETGVDIINFAYNDDNSRSAMFYGSLDVLAKDRPYRKFYSADGSMEIKENRVTGVMDFVTYIGGDGYSAPIVLKSDGTTQNYLYLHRDYQGSLLAITNASGSVVEKRLFDAWGNIVKVQDGSGNALAGLTILDRGYTGHEHLQSVGLINMNGRIYDPKLHRFLQPDNNVQDPFNTQNYNRYGYVLNNPLKYTDPSGEFWNIVIGAAIGGVVNWATHGCQFNAKGLGYFGVGAAAGALTAMGAGGVSSALAGGSFSAGALGTAAACSVGSGFASGAVVGAAGGLVGGFTTGFGNSLVDGKGIGDCFKNGIRDGGIGAITGGIIGGVVSGIQASREGTNFWTGEGTTESTETIGLSSSGEKPIYSNEYARNFSDSNEELMRLSKNTNSLHSDGSFPKGYSSNNGQISGPNGSVHGVTTKTGVFKKSIDVYLSKSAFVSKPQLYMTMHHEYMHAYFFANNINVIDGGHEIIHNWNYAQATKWGILVDIRTTYFSKSYYGLFDTYSRYGFKVINYIP